MMIKMIRNGFYKLIESKNNIKILYLDNDIYAWLEDTPYGEMLTVSHRTHKAANLLGMGHYKLYDVADEPAVSDHIHLELEVSDGVWQGYILLTGLPDNHKARGRIIATNEVITGNPRFRFRSDLTANLARRKEPVK